MSIANWNAITQYLLGDQVYDGSADYYVAVADNLDSPPPSANWTLVPSGGGITSLNGLTDPAMSITSTDTSVLIIPVAPNAVDLSVVPPFPPAYGSFSSQATQNLNVAPTTTPLYYTDDDIVAVNVSSAITSPYLTVANKGTYKVLSSVQLDKTAGGNAPVDLWIELNDVAVPNSATKLSLNQNQEDTMTIEWFVDCGAGQRISIVAYDPTSSGDIRALAVASTLPFAPCPAIPSIITTVLRIA